MWVSRAALVCLSGLAVLIRFLPKPVLSAIGRALGWIWYYLIPIRRRLVLRQLDEALGADCSRAERRRAAREVFENLGLNLVEFLYLDPKRPERVLERIDRRHYSRFSVAEAKGRGVLVLTAHFGNWDLLACSQALFGHNLAILSKTIKPDWLNRYWMESRRACGITILPERDCWNDLTDHLRQGGVVGFVLDQHMPGPRGLAVEFFGRPAATSSGLARLSIETGAPVVPVFLYRGGGLRHVMEVGNAIDPVSANDFDTQLQLTTQAYNQALEAAIRRRPGLWLWLHRRWKLTDP